MSAGPEDDDETEAGLEDTDPGDGGGFNVDDLFDEGPDSLRRSARSADTEAGDDGLTTDVPPPGSATFDGSTDDERYAPSFDADAPAVDGLDGDDGFGDAPPVEQLDRGEGTGDEAAQDEGGGPTAWRSDVDDVVFGDASEWATATPEDFEDDAGDWSVTDYVETARALFGDEPYFGESPDQRFWDRGYQPASQQYEGWLASSLAQIGVGLDDTMKLFWGGTQVVATGFVTAAAIAALKQLDPNLDLSGLHVAEADRRADDVRPEPLPKEIAAIEPRDGVDLRTFCSPVGDQGQTSRCSAFAWTHALELVRALSRDDPARLSCSYTMLGFQRMMGEADSYAFAYSGGEGTVAGTKPGDVLREHGTCRQHLWPDDEEVPRASEHEMRDEAPRYKLRARVQAIAIDDLRHVLSAGCPVHVGMNTGRGFASLGRDGVVDAADAPSGRHGRHAMLIVGYTGNYFILKNSWGTDWGADGFCYLPKRVLAAADPAFVAILHDHAKTARVDKDAEPADIAVHAPWGNESYPATLLEAHGALGRVRFQNGTESWVSLEQLQPPQPAQPPPLVHQPWPPGQRVWAPVGSPPQYQAATVWHVHGKLVYVKLDDQREVWVLASECRA